MDAATAFAAAILPVPPAYSEHRIGDCYSAQAAIQLADTAVAARVQGWGPGDAGMILALDPDGLAGAAVLTGPLTRDLPGEPARAHQDLGSGHGTKH